MAGGHGEGEAGADAVEAAMDGLGNAPDGLRPAEGLLDRKRPLSTRYQPAFGAASRFAFHVKGSNSSRRIGSWLRMRPRMSVN
jgi:hypothetical protein